MKEINLCKPSMLSNACSTPIAHTSPASFIACKWRESELRPKKIQEMLYLEHHLSDLSRAISDDDAGFFESSNLVFSGT